MRIFPARLELLLCTAMFLVVAAPQTQAATTANLVLNHGNIVTLWPEKPNVQAIAIAHHKIIAAGDNSDIDDYIGKHTRVINLNGRTAIPGFIESNGHFLALGQPEKGLDASAAQTAAEVVDLITAAVKKAQPGQWIVASGQRKTTWTPAPKDKTGKTTRPPLGKQLNAVSPHVPVVIQQAGGHALFANARALALAGINKRTSNPKGGTIVRANDGTPTGMLIGAAQQRVLTALAHWRAHRTPGEIKQARIRAIQRAGKKALSHGVTTFVDMSAPFDVIDLYKQLAHKGQLPLRLYVMIGHEPNAILAKRIDGYRMINFGQHDFLTVRGIGGIAVDGPIASHEAWLLKPYSDLKTASAGKAATPLSSILRTAEIAINHHFQLAVKAHGDRAVRGVLDTYESVFAKHPDKTDLRWRIENAALINTADIPRFGKMKVIASVQPIDACLKGAAVITRVGQQRAQAGGFAWQSLIKTGAMLNNGTGTLSAFINPITTFQCAVTRQLQDGSAFQSKQALTREQALESATLWNAYGIFKAQRLGTLMPGKRADIVVLSKNILEIPTEDIDTAAVDVTILNGKIAYQRN